MVIKKWRTVSLDKYEVKEAFADYLNKRCQTKFTAKDLSWYTAPNEGIDVSTNPI